MTQHTGPAHLREMDEAEPRVAAEVRGMPERIFAGSPSVCGNAFGDFDTVQIVGSDTEYVRADLFDAVTRQRDQMQAEIDRLNAQLKPALEACAVIDAIALAGYDNFRDMVMHMLEAVEPSRAALKGSPE